MRERMLLLAVHYGNHLIEDGLCVVVLAGLAGDGLDGLTINHWVTKSY